MSGFDERKEFADKLEREILDHLNSTGYQAFPFGQALLPKECRDLLKRFEDGSGRPCLIRWMPDIIAFRHEPGGKVWAALIDAKHCPDHWDNYSIEMSAAETAEAFADQMYTPTFFVFNGGKALTPRDVRQRGKPGPPPRKGRDASGTPYLLVEKRFAQPFGRYFPKVPSGDALAPLGLVSGE